MVHPVARNESIGLVALIAVGILFAWPLAFASFYEGCAPLIVLAPGPVFIAALVKVRKERVARMDPAQGRGAFVLTKLSWVLLVFAPFMTVGLLGRFLRDSGVPASAGQLLLLSYSPLLLASVIALVTIRKVVRRGDLMEIYVRRRSRWQLSHTVDTSSESGSKWLTKRADWIMYPVWWSAAG